MAIAAHGDWRADPVVQHNILVESIFSAFNGVFMAMAIVAAPVVAVTGVTANPLELTLLVSAFPVGVFFGPLWASVGRRWGMRRLVTQMAVWANLPLFLLFWVDQSWLFTLLVAMAQVLNSAMRMGQSSLYSVLYPRAIRGRVIGRLTFWTYLTMVPCIVLAGWLLEISHESFHVLYPLAGLCGLMGCWFYGMLIVPDGDAPPTRTLNWREVSDTVDRVLGDDKPYRVFQIGYFLSGASFFMSTHVALLLAKDELKFSPLELAVCMSMMPQLVLAISSPFWGRVLDRIGILRCRLIIAFLATVYLCLYWLGIALEVPVLLWIGGMLFGFGNSGGQLTWALGSTYFAPNVAEVPAYNGVHFVLNGIRGLLMPWVGSILLVTTGAWALFAASATSFASVCVSIHSLTLDRRSRRTPAGTEIPPAAPSDG